MDQIFEQCIDWSQVIPLVKKPGFYLLDVEGSSYHHGYLIHLNDQGQARVFWTSSVLGGPPISYAFEEVDNFTIASPDRWRSLFFTKFKLNFDLKIFYSRELTEEMVEYIKGYYSSAESSLIDLDTLAKGLDFGTPIPVMEGCYKAPIEKFFARFGTIPHIGETFSEQLDPPYSKLTYRIVHRGKFTFTYSQAEEAPKERVIEDTGAEREEAKEALNLEDL